MARPLRLERTGAWYHVTGRGLERRAIFRDKEDRWHWLELMGEAVGMFGWRVHGYMLMDNHHHVILQIQETNLSRGMQWFQTSYSMAFNRKYGRVGPLMQGRFKAVLVDPVGWGLELSRYVHLNPVRVAALGLDKGARRADRLGARGQPEARQVQERLERLHQYRWSSYRAYVGLEKGLAWVTREEVLKLVGDGSLHERQRAYARYVEGAIREGLEESPWEHLQGQLILGRDRFVERMREAIRGRHREQPQSRALIRRPKWEEIVGAVERVRGEEWLAFRDRHGDWGRDLALHLGRRVGGLTLRELGEAVGGLDYAAVSAALKRFESRLAKEKPIRRAGLKADQLLNVET